MPASASHNPPSGPTRSATSANNEVPARDDKPVPSALTSTVLTLQRPITFTVNLLSGGIDELATRILPAQADVSDPLAAPPPRPTDESRLGVLVITAEYSTGMIRSTFSAVPRRLPVLWGKALVYGVAVFVVSLPAVFIVFFAGQAILSAQHINIAISHPGVLRALFGAALFLTVMGLFGLGLGAIVRSTAGGIALLAGIVFVLPTLLDLLPTSAANSISPYLPSNAGGAVWTINPDPHTLAPWAGLAVFAAYAALSIAIAGMLLARRDT